MIHRLLAGIYSGMDKRASRHFMKLSLLIAAAWAGGFQCDRTIKDPTLTNFMGVALLAVLTAWYFVLVFAVLLESSERYFARRTTRRRPTR